MPGRFVEHMAQGHLSKSRPEGRMIRGVSSEGIGSGTLCEIVSKVLMVSSACL